MNKVIGRIIALIYVGIMLVCIILVVNPKASLFYYKKVINPGTIKPDAGYAYRFHPIANPLLFRVKDLRFFENETQLA